MTLLVAADLDRTLIYSRAAMRLGEPVVDPVCVEVHDGRPTSFMAPRALAGLVALSEHAVVVPVTTRSRRQYERVALPGVRIPYAVTTNGARLLVDGEPDPSWASEVRRALTTVASYDVAVATLGPLLDRPWVRKRRSAEDAFAYLVLEPELVEPSWYGEVTAAATGLGWVTSRQGRKLYLLPAPLTKEAAVAEVARRVGAQRVAAAGDSLLDRGLLEAADVAVRPAHGELHDTGWTRPGLHVTVRSGGGAAEEIVEVLTNPTRCRGVDCGPEAVGPGPEAVGPGPEAVGPGPEA